MIKKIDEEYIFTLNEKNSNAYNDDFLDFDVKIIFYEHDFEVIVQNFKVNQIPSNWDLLEINYKKNIEDQLILLAKTELEEFLYGE